jgi:sporulation protein YlmC with PRC-barrel domain
VRFSECTHRVVLNTSTAEEVGRLDAFAVDPDEHRVHALIVGKSDGGTVLPWSDVKSFGPDAITVDDSDVIRDPANERDEPTTLVGQRLLTDQGYEIGALDDVEFDEASGALRGLIASERAIDAQALIGVGSYAVIVDHAATTA